MLKLISYLLLLAPLVIGALWLAEHPGEVVIEWQGYEIRMALGILIGLSLFATVIVLVSVLILRSLIRTPKRLSQRAKLRRYEHAIESLNHTMTALALNDYREAQKQLNQSRYYLKSDPAITRLLGVQLAHATGKQDDARSAFDAMLEDSSTRPVALRGKIRELMQEGQWVHARDFAEEAWRDRPSDSWLTMTLLDIYFREKDWMAVDTLLARAVRKKAMNKEQGGHYHAMSLVTRSQLAYSEDDFPKAQQLAEIALKEQPNMLAARIAQCRALAKQTGQRDLLRALEHGWRQQPHPALAKLFVNHACDDTPAKTQKRLARLVSKHPEHEQSLLLEAEVMIRLAQWETARNSLKVAMSKQESAHAYELLAELERREKGDDKQAAVWLAQAVNAPHGAHWLCSHCGSQHESWHPHCHECGQFDSISWTATSARTDAVE